MPSPKSRAAATAAVNFSGDDFVNKAEGFDHPTQLPADAAQQARWQAANRAWWEATPMRYDWREEIGAAPGTEAYYREIDRRFLSSVRKFLPWKRRPFEQLIPFAELPKLDVLEVGVGQGTHAQLIAEQARSFTGIDLTTAASQGTAKRLKVFGMRGRILQMDAEAMEFKVSSFDFIWSWGVIHHSANTRKILEEMHRVLRPGGRATVMVYHRSWWHFHFTAGLRRMFQSAFRKHASLHHAAQHATDGAIARYYTPRDWREATAGLFEVTATRIMGVKPEVVPLPAGRLKDALEAVIPDAVARLLTNHMRQGSFLVAEMRRI
jgi:ubiquinone/menaquinone biosynthesis C-methylase UbiE